MEEIMNEHWEVHVVEQFSFHKDESGQVDSQQLNCEICQKSFPSAPVYKEHINGKKHKKVADQLKQSNKAVSQNDKGNHIASATNTTQHYNRSRSYLLKNIFRLEYFINHISQLLLPILKSTREQLYMQQSRSFKEIVAEKKRAAERKQKLIELGEAALEDAKPKKNEDTPIYDPLHLPIGWDGKPVPYWLYKLHGLNQEFRCEICGNYSYWGPKNFERHFREQRHLWGLKCLGILTDSLGPSGITTFMYITSIEEATKLWERVAPANATLPTV
jgi:splicing factor 3A subunit 3